MSHDAEVRKHVINMSIERDRLKYQTGYRMMLENMKIMRDAKLREH